MTKINTIKYFAASCMIVLYFGLVLEASAEGPVKFFMGSGSVAPGETINLNVSLDKNGVATEPDVLDWHVIYDPAVLSAPVDTDGYPITAIEITALYDGFVSTQCWEVSAGDYQCISDWSYATIPMENSKFDIVTIPFVISSSATVNSTAVSITGATSKYVDPVNPTDEFGSPNYIYQTTEATGGTITISKPSVSADINQDGKVNSVDAALLMGSWGATNKPKADINQDGKVNSVDAAIMMGQWTI